MQKTIEQLFNGEIYPSEQMHIRMEGYEEARKIAFQSHNQFEEKLCKAMKDELDEMIAKHLDASCFEETQTFVNGFKLGARLMAEVFWEDKE